MTWRDELRPGSFRGIPFAMTELSQTGGKRLVVDEYPEQDEHTVDELGRKPRRFRMRGLIVGDAYLDVRDRLRAALEEEGPGQLLHPWRGALQVYTGDYEIGQDGGHGQCTVEFDCVAAPAPDVASPIVELDAVAVTTTSVATAQAAVVAAADSDAFLALPTYYRNAINSGVDAFLAAWQGLLQEGLDALGITTFATLDQVAEVMAYVDDVRRLLAMATQWPAGSPRYSLGTAETPTEAAAADILASFLAVFRVAALARACDVAAAADYLTADAAEEAAGDLVDALTDELDETADPDLFSALIDLRASVVSALTDLATRLPRLRQIDLASARPAIVLAFDLYEDITREAEIVQLNAIGNPAFVAGQLLVLSE